MKHKSLLFLTVTLLICFTGCSSSTPVIPSKDQGESSEDTTESTDYQTINADKAHEIISESSDVIILDVRTESEYASEHIPDAILLPYDEISDQAETKLTDKDQTILVYCRSGRRSAIAASDLAALGYTHVYDFGGIIDWPYDVTTN